MAKKVSKPKKEVKQEEKVAVSACCNAPIVGVRSCSNCGMNCEKKEDNG